MQQQQRPLSDPAYQHAAERLWLRLHRQKPAASGDALLDSLEPEQAILLLHAAIKPHAKTFRAAYASFPWYLFVFLNPLIQLLSRLPGAGELVILCTLLVAISALLYWTTRGRGYSRVRVGTYLIRLLPLCKSTQVLPALLDLALWTDQPNNKTDVLLPKTIARLLTRAGEQELFSAVKFEHRALLRRWCSRNDLPREVVAASLLALSTLRDRETTPIAQRLLTSRGELREAALGFLDVVRP